jgi:hypothetical protein
MNNHDAVKCFTLRLVVGGKESDGQPFSTDTCSASVSHTIKKLQHKKHDQLSLWRHPAVLPFQHPKS